MKLVKNIYKIDKNLFTKESVDQGRFTVISSTNFPVPILKPGEEYLEVLDHNPENIDLSFVEKGAARVNVEHIPNLAIGKIVSTEIKEDKTYSTIEVYPKLREKIFGLIEDGSLTHASVEAVKLGEISKRNTKDGKEVAYRWRLVGIGMTMQPADPACQIVQRSRSDDENNELLESLKAAVEEHGEKVEPLQVEDVVHEQVNTDNIDTEASSEDKKEQKNESNDNLEDIKKEQIELTAEDHHAKIYRNNLALIAGDQHKDLVEEAFNSKMSLPDFKAKIEALNVNEIKQGKPMKKILQLGNILQALSAKAVSAEVQEELNALCPQSDEGNRLIPMELFASTIAKRNFAAGTGNSTTGLADQGGNFIPKDLDADVIQAVHGHIAVFKLGVSMVSAKRGLTVPTIASTSTATWLDENAPAEAKSMTTGQKAVKPRYLRLVYDISNAAIKEADESISLAAEFARDWNNAFMDAIQKAVLSGDPLVDAGSPTGIVTLLKGTPALAAHVKTYAGAVPTKAEIGEVLALLEEKMGSSAQEVKVACRAGIKWGWVSTPEVAGDATYLAIDTGSNSFNVQGRQGMVVPAGALAADQIVYGAFGEVRVYNFHGGMEVVYDDKILAGTNQVRYTVRGAYDVLIRRPEFFVVHES